MYCIVHHEQAYSFQTMLLSSFLHNGADLLDFFLLVQPLRPSSVTRVLLCKAIELANLLQQSFANC